MTALSENIKHSLELLTEMHGLTEAELCRKINVSQATLNRLLTGTSPDPRASTLTQIAQFFNISVDQLIGNKPIAQTTASTTLELPCIPLLTLDNCKSWSKLTSSNWKKWIEIELSVNPKSCFAIEVVGESMWPKFIEGTLLIVNTAQLPKHRDFVIAYLHTKKEALFKQYIEERSTKLLKSINPVFPSIQLTEKDEIIGTVIQARNNLKD